MWLIAGKVLDWFLENPKIIAAICAAIAMLFLAHYLINIGREIENSKTVKENQNAISDADIAEYNLDQCLRDERLRYCFDTGKCQRREKSC